MKHRIQPWDAFELRLGFAVPVVKGSSAVEGSTPMARKVVDGMPIRKEMVDKPSADESGSTREKAVHNLVS